MAISTIGQNGLQQSQILTSVQMPTGSVIQVVSNTFGDTTVNSSNQVYLGVTNGSITITSKAANSKFLIQCSCNGYYSGGGSTNIGLQNIISGTPTRLLGTDGGYGDAWMGAGNGPSSSAWSISKVYLDSPSQAAGTAITYQLLLGNWNAGTSTLNYPGYGGKSSITVTEIVG